MYNAKPTHRTTRVDVLDAVFLVEHIPAALAYMGDDMIPQWHPQRPCVWRVTANGTFPTYDHEVERVVLDAVNDAVEGSTFTKPAKRRRARHIEDAFWDGLLRLQSEGVIRRDGNIIVAKISRTELSKKTNHRPREEDKRNCLRNLGKNLEAHCLGFRKEA